MDKRHCMPIKLLMVLLILLISPLAELEATSRGGKVIILATTTSVVDSGLIDVLIPLFEKQSGFFVKTLAIGSGQAFALGRRGEADVLFIHDPPMAREFIAQGYGINGKIVMYNHYYLVGPPADPARIAEVPSALAALKRIDAKGSLFVSRGDDSGTDRKEKSLWDRAGLKVAGKKWYQETGMGMGQTLLVAAEKDAYTLVDQATYLTFAGKVKLKVFIEGGEGLTNIYQIIEVNPARWPKVNKAGAGAWADFLLKPETQGLIARFGQKEYGKGLFYPGTPTAAKGGR